MVQAKTTSAAHSVESATMKAKLEEEKRLKKEVEARLAQQDKMVEAGRAEVDLLQRRLKSAGNELALEKTKRGEVEAKAAGQGAALRGLANMVQGFVSHAERGYHEKVSTLSNAMASLDGLNARLQQAAGRLQVAKVALRENEVRLRNSAAAVAADRRVWECERQSRELAALADAGALVERPAAPNAVRMKRGAGRLLQGLRPEAEATIRGVFAHLDSDGRGAVDGARLVELLRADRGVSGVMGATVGGERWAAALAALEQQLKEIGTRGRGDVTWGEFLLLCMPSPAGGNSVEVKHPKAVQLAERCEAESGLALVQMVVPEGLHDLGQVRLQGLSVQQLRQAVSRLCRERAYLMDRLRQGFTESLARAESVHKQYQFELQALENAAAALREELDEAHEEAKGLVGKLDESEQELEAARERSRRSQDSWERRLGAAERARGDEVCRLNQAAAQATQEAKDSYSRLSAEHTLLKKDHAKAQVKQRGLERELSRVKDTLEGQAAAEREVLQQQLEVTQDQLGRAKRERNALLVAMREQQKRGRHPAQGQEQPELPEKEKAHREALPTPPVLSPAIASRIQSLAELTSSLLQHDYDSDEDQ
ncbi:unnamed protein product [Chrysoparadoxa australica]